MNEYKASSAQFKVYKPQLLLGQRMSEIQDEAIKLRYDAFLCNGRVYMTLSLMEVDAQWVTATKPMDHP